MAHTRRQLAEPQGKLAVLIPGLGAVSTTLMAGVELMRQGKATPIGSLTQMGTARLGKRTEGRTVPIRELVPLAEVKDVVFGAWDIVHEDAAQVADRSAVLSREHTGPPPRMARLPMALEGLPVEHDLFIQSAKLKNTLRAIAGEELITHVGFDYYGDDLPLPKK
jgi:hypothetical protein